MTEVVKTLSARETMDIVIVATLRRVPVKAITVIVTAITQTFATATTMAPVVIKAGQRYMALPVVRKKLVMGFAVVGPRSALSLEVRLVAYVFFFVAVYSGTLSAVINEIMIATIPL